MVQLIRAVAATADEGHIDSGGSTLYTGSVYCGNGTSAQHSFWRFDNVTVPKNAVITSAYLRLWFVEYPSDDPPDNDAVGSVYGQDEDDPVTFDSYSGGSQPWVDRTATTAGVSWPLGLAWSDASEHDSPDVKTVIQELVNRAGWATGQAMLLWWEDEGSDTGDEWNFEAYGGSNTAKLEINYTEDIEAESGVAGASSVDARLLVDPIELAASVAGSGSVSADMDIPRQFVMFPGTSGNYISGDDRNKLDADTAHIVQSVGLWTVGTVSTNQALFGPSSLLVAGGASTAITPVADDAYFSVAVYSAAGDTFDINSGTGVVVSAGTWTRLTAAGNAGTYTVNAAGSADYYLDEACLQDTDYSFVPSVRVVGDLDLRTSASAKDWDPALVDYICCRDDGTERAYAFRHVDAGTNQPRPQVTWHVGGAQRSGTASADMATADWGWANLRATVDVSVADIDFYENGAALGTTQSDTAGAVDPDPVDVYVGARGDDTLHFTGRIEWAEIRDGIDGPLCAIFSAAQIPRGYGLLPDGYTWTDQTGHTWTVHGTALAYTQDRNTLEASSAAEAKVGGQRDNSGGWRGKGPTLSGPQQDTKLVQFHDDVQLRVDFAPDTISPLQHPSWVSMSTDLISARWVHGRSNERDQASPGSLEITLDNDQGIWLTDSQYNGWVGGAAGPLQWSTEISNWGFPYKGTPFGEDVARFRVGKQIRVQAVYDGTTYDMFRGVIDSIEQRFPVGPSFSQVEAVVNAQDHLLFLSLAETNSTFAAQNPQARIKSLLSETAWPDDTIWRHADTGDRDKGLTETTSTGRVLAPVEADASNVLDLIRSAANSDQGVFLLNTAGQATYHARQFTTSFPPPSDQHYRLTQLFDADRWPNPVFYVTPTSTQAGYMTAEWRRDDRNVWNDATVIPYSTVSSTGATLIEYTGAGQTSVRLYGRRAIRFNESINDKNSANLSLNSRLATAFATPSKDHIVTASIGPGQSHWMADYLPLQQDDYVAVEEATRTRTGTVGSSETKWWPIARRGHVNQLAHDVDIRSKRWEISLNLTDRLYP